VQKKNTLFSIARQFGMTPEELMSLNQLESPKISIGQKLKVKGGSSNPNPKPDPVSGGFGEYVVKKGDTMYSISKMFGMTVDELKAANNLSSNRVTVKMVLKVKKKD
jgi:D-gamma-glutamyl-meso-diaminopimelic acid endopeptidase CwlS